MGQETLNTGISLSYRENGWTEERILLDVISNHLPSDSGGSHTKITVK
ncbi:hypothetical protein HZB02_04875 [Candidatus Woesearchaeota archaeon]|nr:hypothetical protein [Candidatus Woesearchaeota archaeon]